LDWFDEKFIWKSKIRPDRKVSYMLFTGGEKIKEICSLGGKYREWQEQNENGLVEST
jgi:hypothetical protein